MSPHFYVYLLNVDTRHAYCSRRRRRGKPGWRRNKRLDGLRGRLRSGPRRSDGEWSSNRSGDMGLVMRIFGGGERNIAPLSGRNIYTRKKVMGKVKNKVRTTQLSDDGIKS